jgi:hypothetical protein
MSPCGIANNSPSSSPKPELREEHQPINQRLGKQSMSLNGPVVDLCTIRFITQTLNILPTDCTFVTLRRSEQTATFSPFYEGVNTILAHKSMASPAMFTTQNLSFDHSVRVIGS